MLKLVSSLMLVGSLAFGADAIPTPGQNDVMPVSVSVKGVEYPMVALKDGHYSQVYVTPSSAPYFADKNGVSISIENTGVEFSLFVKSGNEFYPMPKGNESKAET